MSSLRSIDANWLIAIVTIAVASVVRGWFFLRRIMIKEQSETDRFAKALEGSTPAERTEIIRAYRQLDRHPAGHDEKAPPDEHVRRIKQL